MEGPTGQPPPPAAGDRLEATPPRPAWWQHWQVVLLFVAAAFVAGTATGMLTWMVFQDDEPQGMVDEEALAAFIEQLPDDRRSSTSVQDLAALMMEPEAGSEELALPTAELSVASDGCGVIRSDLASEPHGLQWSVMDEEGFQVLGRNALGETRYRYFAPGTFTVVLEAWDGAKYAPISNTVTITC